MKTCEQCKGDFADLEQYQCREGHLHSVCEGCLSIITDYAKMTQTGPTAIITVARPATWRSRIAEFLVDVANWVDP
jgi:hypothetical protein